MNSNKNKTERKTGGGKKKKRGLGGPAKSFSLVHFACSVGELLQRMHRGLCPGPVFACNIWDGLLQSIGRQNQRLSI